MKKIGIGLLALGLCLLIANGLTAGCSEAPPLPQAMLACHNTALGLPQAPDMVAMKSLCDCGCANGGPCICDVCPSGLVNTALAAEAPSPTKAVATWYQDSYKRALSAGKSLVVGVGCDAPKGKWEVA